MGTNQYRIKMAKLTYTKKQKRDIAEHNNLLYRLLKESEDKRKTESNGKK